MNLKKGRKRLMYSIGALVILLIAFRLYLPTLVLNYTNKTLSNIEEYYGHVEEIDIFLIKGQYTIKGLEIYKKGNDENPLLILPRTDLSVQWGALKDGEIAGEIDVFNPEINFIIYDGDSEDNNSQTGSEVDWTEPIKDLMPLEINRFSVNNARVHYKDPIQSPAIDIYINDLNVVGSNFTNASDLEDPLPSKITAEGTSIGGGKMYMTMRINPLKKIPDLDYTFKFEGVELKALNDFSSAYGALDFDKGTLDMYSEMVIKDGNIKGYFKPVMINVDLIDFSEDVKNPLKLVWEGFVSALIEIFENQGEDQFASKIPLEGTVDNAQTKLWPTLGSILRNAFVEAFKKQPDDTIDYSQNSIK